LFQNNKYQVSHKHSCFSWWWAHSHPKHVEVDKYTKNKLCTKLALLTWLQHCVFNQASVNSLITSELESSLLGYILKDLTLHRHCCGKTKSSTFWTYSWISTKFDTNTTPLDCWTFVIYNFLPLIMSPTWSSYRLEVEVILMLTLAWFSKFSVVIKL
jgi:hypothetical protein